MTTVRKRRLPPPMARRLKKKKRRIRPRTVLAAAGAAAALGGVLWAVFLTGLFEIREIRVHGGGNLPIESLREKAGAWEGANMFTVSLTEIREMFESDPAVGMVRFRRRPPHRLDCYLREREPVALINLDETVEVDAEGVVIPAPARRSTDIDLPVITGLSKSDLGKDSGKRRIGKALEVLGLLKDFGFAPTRQLSEINLDGEDVVLVWMDSGTLVRVGREGFEERIRKFRAVYPSLLEQGTLPGLIDLRFDRQVIVR